MRPLLIRLLFLLAATLTVIAVFITFSSTGIALPPDAQAALDTFQGDRAYTVTAVQLASSPEKFDGVCSFLEPEEIKDLWCVSVEGGFPIFSHYILHEGEPRWAVIPLLDADRKYFEDIGCQNWSDAGRAQ